MTTSEYTDALRALADPGLSGLHFRVCAHTQEGRSAVLPPGIHIKGFHGDAGADKAFIC